MIRKTKIAVLMGGKSLEHEISLLSGKNIVKSLDGKKYEVLPVVISKTGEQWKLTSKDALLSMPNPIPLKGTKKEIVLSQKKEIGGVRSFSDKKVEVVFVAMHGQHGEDGTIQGMLEVGGIPYTGSGVAASAIGMDKIAFRKIMKAEGFPIPRFQIFEKGGRIAAVYKKMGKLPYFVKPSSQGSSLGASVVRTKKDLTRSITKALKYGKKVLIDEYIKGTEVTCAVLGNNKPYALPVVEIIPLKGEFFDYESKYTESGSEEIVPARIPKQLSKVIQQISLKVYKAVGCRGFARVDMIIRNNKYPVVLEINTIPGLTPMSLTPKAAKAAGISYPRLLDKIIEYAKEIH
ncbi:MAG TPA: D-alanine--D-alanine ligase [Patescibacteria group bacterium]|nr:D-alanine--D-alanine ligase [Patescibacteria group bacterium]